MPQTRKIATCCYCGLRAFLVLDKNRHELVCSGCGAPLREMKVMPAPRETAPTRREPPKPAPLRQSAPNFSTKTAGRKCRKTDKRRRRKPLFRKIFEEIWDELEDIFD